MQVIICGGRDFNDKAYLNDMLTFIREQRDFNTVITGGARGADSLAHQWAVLQVNMHTMIFYAEWDQFGKRAGFIRNEQMLNQLNEGSNDFVIAFPGGNGTAHMIRIAEQRGFNVLKL